MGPGALLSSTLQPLTLILQAQAKGRPLRTLNGRQRCQRCRSDNLPCRVLDGGGPKLKCYTCGTASGCSFNSSPTPRRPASSSSTPRARRAVSFADVDPPSPTPAPTPVVGPAAFTDRLRRSVRQPVPAPVPPPTPPPVSTPARPSAPAPLSWTPSTRLDIGVLQHHVTLAQSIPADRAYHVEEARRHARLLGLDLRAMVGPMFDDVAEASGSGS